MYMVIELMRDRPTKYDYVSLKAYELKRYFKGFSKQLEFRNLVLTV